MRLYKRVEITFLLLQELQKFLPAIIDDDQLSV